MRLRTNVITGDTQEYRIFEGLAPTMQPSDIGMATNPMPGVFEWWYFQGLVTGNSTFQITLLTKPWVDNNGPLQPYATIAVTTPNGTHLFGETKVRNFPIQGSSNTMNVTMGDTWARGDLNNVNLHFAPTDFCTSSSRTSGCVASNASTSTAIIVPYLSLNLCALVSRANLSRVF